MQVPAAQGRTRPPNSVPPPPPPSGSTRRPVPVPFGDEPTRQVDDELLTALRNAAPAKPSPKPGLPPPKPGLPRPGGVRPALPDEPTRMSNIDAISREHEEMTRPSDDFPPRFLQPRDDGYGAGFEDLREGEDATRLASLDGIAAMERARNHGPSHDERTRAVNIRNDPSISDIDWDLD
jgi:hypothetical protein